MHDLHSSKCANRGARFNSLPTPQSVQQSSRPIRRLISRFQKEDNAACCCWPHHHTATECRNSIIQSFMSSEKPRGTRGCEASASSPASNYTSSALRNVKSHYSASAPISLFFLFASFAPCTKLVDFVHLLSAHFKSKPSPYLSCNHHMLHALSQTHNVCSFPLG